MVDEPTTPSSPPPDSPWAAEPAPAKPARKPRAKPAARAASGAAARPASKRSASKRPAAKPRAAPKRRPSAKAGAEPAPDPVRRPLDIEVAMRPVPQPGSRSARLASLGHAAPEPAASPAGAAPPPRRSRLRALLGMAIVLGLLAAAAMPATSQGNTGTIKVHDGTGTQPPTRNEPHVAGDAWVEGFNMAVDGGDLLFYSWPPTGDMTLVLATNWTADDAEPAFHFLAGPFDLPCGHYRAFAYNGDGPEDPTEPQPGGAKKKSFWVDCEETPPTCGTEGQPPCCGGEGTPPCPTCGTEDTPPCPTCGTEDTPPCATCGTEDTPPCIVCPTDLAAVANADGTVTLTWTPAPGSDGTNVYRAEGDGDFDYVTTVAPDVGTWTDNTTVAGNAYSYTVTGLFGDQESTDCGLVEVTAVPELPTLAAVGLATGGGAIALAFALRRRKA